MDLNRIEFNQIHIPLYKKLIFLYQYFKSRIKNLLNDNLVNVK